MKQDYLTNLIRRSRLIMPIHNRRFIEQAYLRNADCIVLDLEDSVPPQEKIKARELVKETIPIVKKGGSDVLVRVNNQDSLLRDDINSSVWPGIDGIYLPKVESVEEVEEIDKLITALEIRRRIKPNSITLGITIETAKGLQQVNEIAKSSGRIDSISLGVEDFSLDTGIHITEDTSQAMLYPRMKVLLAARANKILPLGLMGSIAGFQDLDGIERSAILAYKHGFLGASCIHPSNIEILNKCFSPSQEEVSYSKRVIDKFEEVIEQGKASAELDGRMIDTPHYEKAKQILLRHEKIMEMEKRKLRARESIKL